MTISVIEQLFLQISDLLIPSTFEELIWWAIGGTFGRSFGKKLDYDIQQGDWFKRLDVLRQILVKRTLDFTHHWWIGALMMLYWQRAYWFGAGILVDDLPDLYKRVKGMMKIIAKYLS